MGGASSLRPRDMRQLCVAISLALSMTACAAIPFGGTGTDAAVVLPQVFAATLQIDDWDWRAGEPSEGGTGKNVSFKLLYDGTAPGYHLSMVSANPKIKLESWQSEERFAVFNAPSLIPTWRPGCSVIPSAWVGWWDWLRSESHAGALHVHLGLERCPGQAPGGERLCDTFTPSGDLFDKVRLWTARAGAGGTVEPVALRWPVGFWFGAPFAGVHRQIIQIEMQRFQIAIFRDFTPLTSAPAVPPAAAVLPPFPDEKTCDFSPVTQSHELCPVAMRQTAADGKMTTPSTHLSQSPATDERASEVLTFVVSHPPDMLVGYGASGSKPSARLLRLDNVNVADTMGEAFFYSLFLTQPNLKGLGDLHLMSAVQVEVNTSWGLYQGCNAGICEREMWALPNTTIDPNFTAVGRVTLDRISPPLVTSLEVSAAQCGPVGRFGSWFHLPAGGKCGPGEAVGDGACTWQQLRVVKTIDTRSCLLKNQALMKSIETWAKWLLPMCTLLHKCTPPTAMAKAISAAFSSDDVAKGGCLPL